MSVVSRTSVADLLGAGIPAPVGTIFLSALCRVNPTLDVEFRKYECQKEIDVIDAIETEFANGYGIRLNSDLSAAWIEAFHSERGKLWVIYATEDDHRDPDSAADDRDCLPVGVSEEALSHELLVEVLVVRIRELQARTA